MGDSTHIIQIVLLTLDVINVLLHIFALYLLKVTYTGRRRTVQHLFLINLSTTELFRNILYIVSDVFQMRGNMKAASFVYYVSWTFAYSAYFFAMVVITGDRLAAVRLSVRYKVVWGKSKTFGLILLTWLLCAVTCVCSMVVIWSSRKTPEQYASIPMSVANIGNCVFLLFAIYSYVVIFMRFTNSRRTSCGSRAKISRLQMFRQSKFHISLLIVTSFLLLTVVPCIVYFVVHASGHHLNIFGEYYIFISMTLSDTVDAIIYVLVSNPINNVRGSGSVAVRNVRNALLGLAHRAVESIHHDSAEHTQVTSL